MARRSKTDSQAMVALNNKQNLAQRDEFYAAVHKNTSTPARDLHCVDRIPGQLYKLYSPFKLFIRMQPLHTNLIMIIDLAI